jgi:Heparinase II/III N-terminus/Heparinase II/III-like protein
MPLMTAASSVRRRKDNGLNRATFAHLLRRATSLPPHRAVAKAASFAGRRARAAWERHQDLTRGTYAPFQRGLPWRNRVSVRPEDIAPDFHEPLRLLGDCHRSHCFDLLGSGWVEVNYGMACNGFAGRSFPAQPRRAADRDDAWLTGELNASNVTGARELWRRIDDESYRPIDWQLDFRSGYRWRADAHFSTLEIPVDTGADVKVPWELGRLQHLPQLALCAILARSGAKGFAPAEDYVRELRHQLLDFLALNPPRFGVNWMCPMDVGIRVANMLLALDLVIGAGLGPGQDLIDVVLRAAREHADHIANHLEWSERGRSNHYLANLVGLLWAASYLPSDSQTDEWLAFASAELPQEADRQFLPDGGNYEGSTNYHRLSGEIVLFGVALLAALGRAAVPVTLCDKLLRAAELTRAITRPGGGVVQIGDTDSGRWFKLTPVGRTAATANGVEFREDALDHRTFVDGVGALFRIKSVRTIDAVAAERLAAGRTFAAPRQVDLADYGNLDAAIAAIEALPADCRRRRHIDIAGAKSAAMWRRSAFPDFGLYIFSASAAFIAFRCAPRPPAGAPLGHTHDDNLGVEYVLGSERRIDPGSLCYTPSRMLRDRYREAAAHDVPRAIGWDVAAPGDDLFALQHLAWARCLAWQPNGVAGEISAPHGTIMRALRLTASGIDIYDGVTPPNRLRPLSSQIAVANGYGWAASVGASTSMGM